MAHLGGHEAIASRRHGATVLTGVLLGMLTGVGLMTTTPHCDDIARSLVGEVEARRNGSPTSGVSLPH